MHALELWASSSRARKHFAACWANDRPRPSWSVWSFFSDSLPPPPFCESATRLVSRVCRESRVRQAQKRRASYGGGGGGTNEHQWSTVHYNSLKTGGGHILIGGGGSFNIAAVG
jgi:hypothetical protein